MTEQCPSRTSLDDFVSGACNAEQHALLAQHAAVCPRCQERIARLRSDQAFEAQVRSAVLGTDRVAGLAGRPAERADSLTWRLEEDRQFGRVLISAAIATQAAVDQAAQQQQDALAGGKLVRLSDLLVRAGVITPREAERAFQQIEAPYRYCRKCQQRLLIIDARPGKRVRCPHCLTDFEL